MKVLIEVSSKLVISSIATTFAVKSSFQLFKSESSLRKLPFHLRLTNPFSVPLSEHVLPICMLVLTLFVCSMHRCVVRCPDASANSVSLPMVLFLVLFLRYPLLPSRIKLKNISKV